MNISVCIPSYKRLKVETLKYIPYAKVYVDESEYNSYVEANEGATIISCKKGIQGNVARIRNHIMQTELNDGADCVCIVDDDMRTLYWWVDTGNGILKMEKIPSELVLPLIEKYSQICKDMGFYHWGVNCNMDRLSYRECAPLSTLSFIGAPFSCFLKGNECLYDEQLSLKEDYDMTIQQCNKYRGCLRVNSICYDVKQSEQTGGCASYRNYDKEKAQLELLQRKWGTGIVKIDHSNKGKTKKVKMLDYNPIIKVPIRGI